MTVTLAASGRSSGTPGGPLLRVRDLHTEFRGEDGAALRAVDGVSFGVVPGRALAIVGESGSGKSVSMRSVLRLLPRTGRVTAGEVWFGGQDLLRLPERQMRRIQIG